MSEEISMEPQPLPLWVQYILRFIGWGAVVAPAGSVSLILILAIVSLLLSPGQNISNTIGFGIILVVIVLILSIPAGIFAGLVDGLLLMLISVFIKPGRDGYVVLMMLLAIPATFAATYAFFNFILSSFDAGDVTTLPTVFGIIAAFLSLYPACHTARWYWEATQ